MPKNTIHPDARLIGDVRLGEQNVIEAGAVIIGPIRIGDGNFFGINCVVGAPAQDELVADDLRHAGDPQMSDGLVRIGDRNVLREFVTVHRGLTGETVMGDDNYLMAYSHVEHDCTVRDRVKFASNVHTAGYCWIGSGAYLGLSSSLHQFIVVGGHSMVGMGSVVTRSVPLGSLLYGNPARPVRPNIIGLERIGVSRFDWWEGLQRGASDVEVPEGLAKDFAEFEVAVARSSELRASVSAWRDSRREQGGHD